MVLRSGCGSGSTVHSNRSNSNRCFLRVPATLFQDFDRADEVLHSQIGREWYVPNLQAALDYGDRCWSKVMSHWRRYLDEGQTRHHNWWPELYRAACAHRGSTPDAATLAYNTTYEAVRADLRPITDTENLKTGSSRSDLYVDRHGPEVRDGSDQPHRRD